MNLVKTLVIAAVLNTAAGTVAMAQDNLSKAEVKEQAVDICHTEAQRRYGENAIVYSDETARYSRDTSRAKWNKSLRGAMVKMRIKGKSKRSTKYECLVKTDRTVTFFKV